MGYMINVLRKNYRSNSIKDLLELEALMKEHCTEHKLNLDGFHKIISL